MRTPEERFVLLRDIDIDISDNDENVANDSDNAFVVHDDDDDVMKQGERRTAMSISCHDLIHVGEQKVKLFIAPRIEQIDR